jgi:hypothetical protein
LHVSDLLIPIFIGDVADGVFAIRFSPNAAEALGIDVDTDLRLFTGPGGRTAADAYVDRMLRQLAEVTQ